MKMWYYALLAEPQIFIDLGQLGSWVDVRDCALGHVLSLENSSAGGERLLIAAPGMFVCHSFKTLFFFPSLFLQ